MFFKILGLQQTLGEKGVPVNFTLFYNDNMETLMIPSKLFIGVGLQICYITFGQSFIRFTHHYVTGSFISGKVEYEISRITFSTK